MKNKFLWIAGFVLLVFIVFIAIDYYYVNKSLKGNSSVLEKIK